MKTFKTWTNFELYYLLAFTAIGIALSVLWQSDIFSFISCVTGIVCVVLVSKGSLWTYPIGIVQVLAYAWTAYQVTLYSEVILQIYFFAIQIVGWIAWSKHMDNNTKEVRKRILNKRELIFWTIGTIIFVMVYHYFLVLIGAALPLYGSMSTSLSIIAMLLMVVRSKWQWATWFIVNIISIIMWITQGDYLMAFLFVFYITNNFYGWKKWSASNV